ncbi:MAG: hypothetical protein NPIRA04_10870 [Nitrospirales bacterium]|nr:MAG: hypothetical protein NPIRA04_10870 [Nitrospirales bacterium]
MNAIRIHHTSSTFYGYLMTILIMVLPVSPGEAKNASPPPAEEPHLKNIRQLTTNGKNAEAYFSFGGNTLVFQSTNDPELKTPLPCYQIYTMDLEGKNQRRVSTGYGGTTCGYFFPGDRRVLFSSTHMRFPHCPPAIKRTKHYRWALDDYDIFSAHVSGLDLQRLTASPGYDAEATVSPNGRTIVFTSVREGDLDIYSMDINGTNIKKLTHQIGYDGGAFFSPDSTRIVYRASHPDTPETLKTYQDLLAKNMVEPSNLEIFIMNADGSDQHAVTQNGASNFAPFFYPDGKHIIFSSNISSKSEAKGRPSFHLYSINDQGEKLEQITTHGHFNSFPMFSPDGSKVVWVSDRNASKPGEFNVFLADWVP